MGYPFFHLLIYRIQGPYRDITETLYGLFLAWTPSVYLQASSLTPGETLVPRL
jgi:hypothetical protein